MCNESDQENFLVFLSTLTKEQLIRLALHDREVKFELRMRYVRMRSAALDGDTLRVEQLSQFDRDTPPPPEDLSFGDFLAKRVWTTD